MKSPSKIKPTPVRRESGLRDLIINNPRARERIENKHIDEMIKNTPVRREKIIN